MLVIPRKKDEAIVIDDDIEVAIIEIRGDEVRLAISYPDGATVHRGEEEVTPAG